MKAETPLGGLEHKVMRWGRSGITKGPLSGTSAGFDFTDSMAATVKREKPLKASLAMRRLFATS